MGVLGLWKEAGQPMQTHPLHTPYTQGGSNGGSSCVRGDNTNVADHRPNAGVSKASNM